MSGLYGKVKIHFRFPITFNDGILIPNALFAKVKNYFIKSYGGLTVTGGSKGYWKHANVVYADETVEYFVIIPKKIFYEKIRPLLPKQLTRFKMQFRQLAILCYYHDVVST